MQAADGLDGPATEQKALIGEGIKNCRKIIANYRIALMPDPPAAETDDEAGSAEQKR